MPGTHELANYFASALLAGFHAALPVLIFVTVAALAASVVQAFIGFGDPAIGLALRVAGGVAALILFGKWSAGAVLASAAVAAATAAPPILASTLASLLVEGCAGPRGPRAPFGGAGAVG